MTPETSQFQPSWSGFAEPITGRACSPRALAQPEKHVADLWKDYFTDPFQWWDIRKSKVSGEFPFRYFCTGIAYGWIRSGTDESESSVRVCFLAFCFAKTNPKAPDFKHKVSKESLWIDGRYNPCWVRDRLQLQKAGEFCGAVQQGHAGDEEEEASAGGGQEVLRFVEEELASLEQGVPSVENLACLLHKCTKERNLAHALRLHSYMREMGLEAHRSLGNSLVSMLVEVGRMSEAQQIFDRLVYRNDCSWNSLITGYIKRGESGHALILYQAMQQDDSIHLRMYNFVALLKACAQLKDLERGREIHAEIARKGLLHTNIFIGSTLVHMYAKCGLLAKAHEVLDMLPVRDTVSWNALITGYVEHGCGVEALNTFEQMQLEGISPDATTFICILKACGRIGATEKGLEIHAEIARKELEGNLFVGSTLVDMYCKCGLLAKAQEVFDKLPVRNTVSWSALIAGYAEHGYGEEALCCFLQMQVEGVSPDYITFVYSLKACGSIGAADKGQEIHAEISRKGLEGDLFVGSTLVDMYAKCGLLEKAQEVFDKLPVQNTVSWNALITGYAEHGRSEAALNCFEKMQLEGVSPDAVTFVCSLKASGSIGATEKGREIHAEIVRKGLERDLVIGSTLVDMYAKCGLLSKAHEVFDKLPVRSTVAWNALMAGYTQLGESENVFHIFDRMIVEGEKPNLVTFLCVLTACSHAGLVDEGLIYFEAMSKDYGIIPTLEHHTCMVDALGRAGQLGKAIKMIKEMPFHPDLAVWHAMLGACRKQGCVELGRQAFEHAVRLNEKDGAAYVCMYNIYANAGMQVDANKVEAMRVRNRAWKEPGHSWNDAGGTVLSFLVGDKRHSPSKNIYEKLENLSSKTREANYAIGVEGQF